MLPIPLRKSHHKVWADLIDGRTDGETRFLPLPNFPSGGACVTSSKQFTRREFLVIGGSVAVGALAGASLRAPRAVAGSSPNHVIFRLSLRGRRGSKAAKLHNANMRFATESAAKLHHAHPGDRSRVVQLTVSAAVFQRLFPSPDREVADLRKIVLGCIGDCNRDNHVTVNEVVTMVRSALGGTPASVCRQGDANRDARIGIDETLTALNNALRDCP